MNFEKGFDRDKKYKYLNSELNGVQMSYISLLESLYGVDFIKDNPYVFVYEFEIVEQ